MHISYGRSCDSSLVQVSLNVSHKPNIAETSPLSLDYSIFQTHSAFKVPRSIFITWKTRERIQLSRWIFRRGEHESRLALFSSRVAARQKIHLDRDESLSIEMKMWYDFFFWVICDPSLRLFYSFFAFFNSL